VLPCLPVGCPGGAARKPARTRSGGRRRSSWPSASLSNVPGRCGQTARVDAHLCAKTNAWREVTSTWIASARLVLACVAGAAADKPNSFPDRPSSFTRLSLSYRCNLRPLLHDGAPQLDFIAARCDLGVEADILPFPVPSLRAGAFQLEPPAEINAAPALLFALREYTKGQARVLSAPPCRKGGALSLNQGCASARRAVS
jgi:hypothetical protein